MLGILLVGETYCICHMSYLGHVLPWLCGHAFPELECLDFIYGYCCCNSHIGFVLVDVFYSHLVLFGDDGGGLDT